MPAHSHTQQRSDSLSKAFGKKGRYDSHTRANQCVLFNVSVISNCKSPAYWNSPDLKHAPPRDLVCSPRRLPGCLSPLPVTSGCQCKFNFFRLIHYKHLFRLLSILKITVKNNSTRTLITYCIPVEVAGVPKLSTTYTFSLNSNTEHIVLLNNPEMNTTFLDECGSGSRQT